ncbi:right-handed parallel beta-helix repeat-containing protein [Candidatus Uhrbacteria bacterium]|nr:right-handed parallel beta-helix repeat-containing protein [Candidatus Uhrbacteria bacterium]
MKKTSIFFLICFIGGMLITGDVFAAPKKIQKKPIKQSQKIVKTPVAKIKKKSTVSTQKKIPSIPAKNSIKIPSLSVRENILTNTTREGEVTKNETWSGRMTLTHSVNVIRGVTLTIKPGTIVAFAANRDYKHPEKTGLSISGTLKAIGTPEKQILFTSADPHPQNGDWSMIHLEGKTGSIISYVIIEFGQQGVNVWQSDITISHSIIRWNNWEGLYAESYSTPLIEYNRVYQNGYNGMAMEQFNKAIVRNNIFEKNGTHGLHIDASEAIVENNILNENGAAGISLDDTSMVTAINNTMSKNTLSGFMCGEGKNALTAIGNSIIPQNPSLPDSLIRCADSVLIKNESGDGAQKILFDYPDGKIFDLGYTPGDRIKDMYQYIYPDDETRKVVKKIGTGLGLTWSLAMDGKNVWTATVSGDVYKLDGETGKILKQFKVTSPQPWGMTFDGQYLWITDFAEKRTYSMDPETGKEIFSFLNPDQERGAKGLAWDGKYLYIMGWITSIVYKIDRQGNLIDQWKMKDIDGGGGLTYDGTYFWIPVGNRIGKFDTNGKLVGVIYIASEGTWDLAWEKSENAYGGYLWATQRTNENWHDDEKIYKLEIIDDQIAR